ncbi:ATP-binding protein [Streptomyces sp. NPDC006458]|uniref:ATP-binding protein n=1 Tax=Streptomyces sp. NPDC006458 TaxID=3154302 RepID=UPI0033A56980
MTTTAVSPPRASSASHRVALARSRHAPAVARRITGRWLAVRGVAHGPASDALLIVSELVTNAMRHTSGRCTLALTVYGGEVDIAVADTSPQVPRLRAGTDVNAPGGRGLALVCATGARITVAPASGGKTVHAVLDLGQETRQEVSRGDLGGPDDAARLRTRLPGCRIARGEHVDGT